MSIEHATLGLFVATVVLALITYFHMRHGKRLADAVERAVDVMKQEFEMHVSPLVDVRLGIFSRSGRSPNSRLKCTVTARNLGTHPCYIKNAKFICSPHNHPGERIEQAISGLTSETPLGAGVSSAHEVEIKGESWMIDQPKNYVFSVEMEIAGEDRRYQSSRREFSNFP